MAFSNLADLENDVEYYHQQNFEFAFLKQNQ